MNSILLVENSRQKFVYLTLRHDVGQYFLVIYKDLLHYSKSLFLKLHNFEMFEAIMKKKLFFLFTLCTKLRVKPWLKDKSLSIYVQFNKPHLYLKAESGKKHGTSLFFNFRFHEIRVYLIRFRYHMIFILKSFVNNFAYSNFVATFNEFQIKKTSCMNASHRLEE